MNLTCTNCGAILDVDGSTQTPACAFCGTHNLVPEDVWRRLRPVELEPVPRPVPGRARPALFIVLAAAAIVATVSVWLVGKRRARPPSPVAAAGSACNGSDAACSPDGKMLLECEGGKLVPALACKGPKGCRATEHGRSVSCDYTLADENDPCNVKDSACRADRKAELRCDGSKFVLASPCEGPDGCTVAPTSDGYQLTCDDHVAQPNAPCLEDGRFACALDGRSMLRCARGHFTLASTCKGPGGCRVSKNRVEDTTSVSCDGDFSDVGDPCQPDHHACTTDKKALLACENGTFAISKRCARGCSASNNGLDCR